MPDAEPLKQADLRPHQDAINQAIANLKRAADRYSIRQPTRWVTGISPEAWLAATESYSWPQYAVIGIDQKTFNERSKPVGLTKRHEYKDIDGDEITIINWQKDGAIAHIETPKHGVYLKAGDSVPLALNVLGYDRPGILGGFETVIGGQVSSGVVINGQGLRDKTLAIAIANLKSVDRYDQRVAERKNEEEAQAAKQAKRDELLAARDKANDALHEAANRLNRVGIYRDSIDGLAKALDASSEAQAALSAFVDGV